MILVMPSLLGRLLSYAIHVPLIYQCGKSSCIHTLYLNVQIEMIGFRPSRLKRLPTPTLDLPDCGMSSRDCEKTDKHHGREYSHRIYNDEG